jgi:hypothetical protein
VKIWRATVALTGDAELTHARTRTHSWTPHPSLPPPHTRHTHMSHTRTQIYDTFDLNGDGKLSVPEFSMLLAKHPNLKDTADTKTRQTQEQEQEQEQELLSAKLGAEEGGADGGSGAGSARGDETDDETIDAAIFEGWLYKRGLYNPGFKQRWFVLREGHEKPGVSLSWYKSQEDSVAHAHGAAGHIQGEVLLAGMHLEADAGFDGQVACFSLTPADVPENQPHVRRIILAADLKEERQVWTDKLADAKAKSDRAQKRRSLVYDIIGDHGLLSQRAPLEGWVHKKGDWRNPTFQRRWFSLREHHDKLRGMVLYYFAKEEDAKDLMRCKGSLVCTGMTIEENLGMMNDLHCFAMTSTEGTSNRRMVCGCETAHDRHRWTSVLTSASRHAMSAKEVSEILAKLGSSAKLSAARAHESSRSLFQDELAGSPARQEESDPPTAQDEADDDDAPAVASGLRATLVLVIDTTLDECAVTRTAVGPLAAEGPGEGADREGSVRVLDYGLACELSDVRNLKHLVKWLLWSTWHVVSQSNVLLIAASVIARAVKAARRRVLVAGAATCSPSLLFSFPSHLRPTSLAPREDVSGDDLFS